MSLWIPIHRGVIRVRERVRTTKDVWLGLRMLAWASALPALKHMVALERLVRLVQRNGAGRLRDRIREDQIITFARWACRFTRVSRDGNCLERGLLAYRFLGAANAAPSLVVGVARSSGGNIRGHAWVLVDGQPAGESPASLADFATVVTFDAKGAPISGKDADRSSTR